MASQRYLIYTCYCKTKLENSQDHATRDGTKTLCGREPLGLMKNVPFNLESVYACDKCRRAAARILEEYGKRL